MKTDLIYLKKLMKMLDESGIAELEIEEEGSKIRLAKPQNNYITGPSPSAYQIPQEIYMQQTDNLNSEQKKEETELSDNVTEIRSPMVGTYYKAPSPDADPYVQVGSVIKPGTVICIIEAMKLMNEIESEIDGKILKILVENGQAVEYDQPLFLVEKI